MSQYISNESAYCFYQEYSATIEEMNKNCDEMNELAAKIRCVATVIIALSLILVGYTIIVGSVGFSSWQATTMLGIGSVIFMVDGVVFLKKSKCITSEARIAEARIAEVKRIFKEKVEKINRNTSLDMIDL